MSSRPMPMARHLARILADVEVAVVPAVRRDERRDVETAAAEIRDEHAPAGQPRKYRGEAARHDMLLMTMDDRRAAQRSQHRRRNGIRSLAPDVTRIVQNQDFQTSDVRCSFRRTERDQTG